MRLLATLILLTVSSLAAAQQEKISLFNGKDLNGWVAEGDSTYKDKATGETKPVWSVKDGNLFCDGKGFGFLRFGQREFGDFVFHLEYKLAPRCNSGVGVRTPRYDPAKSEATRPSYASYEIQLIDDAGRAPHKHGTASLYRYVAPAKNLNKPAGEWNVLEVECAGPRIKVRLNGEQVIDFDQTTLKETESKPLRGSVCVQNHGGKVEFRDLWVRELGPRP